MSKKNAKTVNTEEAEEHGNYHYIPVYITANGNNIEVINSAILTTLNRVEELNEEGYKTTVYITVNSGNPNQPPNCVPGQPGCSNG